MTNMLDMIYAEAEEQLSESIGRPPSYEEVIIYLRHELLPDGELDTNPLRRRVFVQRAL